MSIMNYNGISVSEYGNVKVGDLKLDQQGKRERFVRCKGIRKNENGVYIALWQYVNKATLKPTGKQSTCFFENI